MSTSFPPTASVSATGSMHMDFRAGSAPMPEDIDLQDPSLDTRDGVSDTAHNLPSHMRNPNRPSKLLWCPNSTILESANDMHRDRSANYNRNINTDIPPLADFGSGGRKRTQRRRRKVRRNHSAQSQLAQQRRHFPNDRIRNSPQYGTMHNVRSSPQLGGLSTHQHTATIHSAILGVPISPFHSTKQSSAGFLRESHSYDRIASLEHHSGGGGSGGGRDDGGAAVSMPALPLTMLPPSDPRANLSDLVTVATLDKYISDIHRDILFLKKRVAFLTQEVKSEKLESQLALFQTIRVAVFCANIGLAIISIYDTFRQQISRVLLEKFREQYTINSGEEFSSLSMVSALVLFVRTFPKLFWSTLIIAAKRSIWFGFALFCVLQPKERWRNLGFTLSTSYSAYLIFGIRRRKRWHVLNILLNSLWVVMRYWWLHGLPGFAGFGFGSL